MNPLPGLHVCVDPAVQLLQALSRFDDMCLMGHASWNDSPCIAPVKCILPHERPIPVNQSTGVDTLS